LVSGQDYFVVTEPVCVQLFIFGIIPLANLYCRKSSLSKYRRNKMPSTGEKPGKGTYKCKRCGTKVTLDDDTDTLPPCPKCHHTEFDEV